MVKSYFITSDSEHGYRRQAYLAEALNKKYISRGRGIRMTELN